MSRRILRALVVDDSTLNRNEVMMCLSGMDDVEVVGLAASGAEALRLAPQLKPDVITLDLLMPGIDGFSVLRILPTLWQCPILVLSGSTGSREVFKALELGALDFIPKPETSAERLKILPQVLREKLEVVRALSPAAQNRTSRLAVRPPVETLSHRPTAAYLDTKPRYIIAIAASTGGPAAITALLGGLDPSLNFGVVIAQHMPDKFTLSFAERLDRHLSLSVSEAAMGSVLSRSTVQICPGRRCMEISLRNNSYVASIHSPAPDARYIPNADRLLSSAANAAGSLTIGIVLTGMGDDGLAGARQIGESGGIVIAESEATAIVYGMPRAVTNAGLARRTLPLHEIAHYVNDLVRK